MNSHPDYLTASPGILGDPSEERLPPWRKVLYCRQPYEDNYTDAASFLAELVTNANVVQRDYWTVVRNSVVVSQQISVVATVATVAAYTLRGQLHDATLFAIDGAALLTGLLALLLTEPWELCTSGAWAARAFNCILLVGGVYILSPVLHSLTSSISSDTIFTSTVYLLLLHLLLHDYRGDREVPSSLPANVSLTAAILSSVLLASRLHSRQTVFGIMLFALELFVFFPAVCFRTREHAPGLHSSLAVITTLLCGSILLPLNVNLGGFFCLTIVFVTFLCPYWLVHIQRYKYEIQGPWDEAKPVLAQRAQNQ